MSAQLNPQSIPCVIDSSFNKGAFLTIAYYLIIIKTENIVLQQEKGFGFSEPFVGLYGFLAVISTEPFPIVGNDPCVVPTLPTLRRKVRNYTGVIPYRGGACRLPAD